MESILAMSQLAGKNAFERSSLPSESQLDLHVNGLEFLSLVQRIVLTPEIWKSSRPPPTKSTAKRRRPTVSPTVPKRARKKRPTPC